MDKEITNRDAKMYVMTYSQRVQQLIDEGCTNSDAQAIADMEESYGMIKGDFVSKLP